MIEVAVNIGVVELDAGQDDMAGPVVEKLRPLIKKCRVILVALEHHIARPCRRSSHWQN